MPMCLADVINTVFIIHMIDLFHCKYCTILRAMVLQQFIRCILYQGVSPREI